MKQHVKNAMSVLEANDFRLDREDRKLRTDRWVFTHANAPDDRLILNIHMSEPAARTVTQRARAIVGLGTSDAKAKKPARVNTRAKAERAAQRQRIEATRKLADAKDQERLARQLAEQLDRRNAELNGLINGRRDIVSTVAIATDAMLTIEQAADETGVTDVVVRRAIDSGALDAYMCAGGVIKVKGSEIRAWLSKASA